MKILRSAIPKDSLMANYLPSDYMEAYECSAPNSTQLTPDNILMACWSFKPKWVEFLFLIRDILVKPLGLKTGNEREGIAEFVRQSIIQKNERETVMRLADKHLTAELSIYTQPLGDRKSVKFITAVHFHNTLGRIYFFIIKPFHKIIVKAMMRRSVYV